MAKPITNVIVKQGGRRWRIREARSFEDVANAIASARVSGSVGAVHILDQTYTGGDVTTLADVVQIHSDGSECQPYNHST